MIDFDRSETAWAVSLDPVPYLQAVAAMERRATEIRDRQSPELVWLVEHPPLYTAGTSARAVDLKDPARFPVFSTGRGGQYTYHGPGQRIAYVMLDVQRRFGSDVRAFVATLERWIISTLAELGIEGQTRPGRVGVWVVDPEPTLTERKIAAIGIRIRRGVSFHGISLNVAPNLAHYDGIVPCGIAGHGVTSLADQGRTQTMKTVDRVLERAFIAHFGACVGAEAPLAGIGKDLPVAIR